MNKFRTCSELLQLLSMLEFSKYIAIIKYYCNTRQYIIDILIKEDHGTNNANAMVQYQFTGVSVMFFMLDVSDLC